VGARRLDAFSSWLAAGALAGVVASGVDGVFTVVRGPWVASVPVVAAGVLGFAGAIAGVLAVSIVRMAIEQWRRLGVERVGAALVVTTAGGSLLLAAAIFAIGLSLFAERTPSTRLRAFGWLVMLAIVAVGACMRLLDVVAARRKGAFVCAAVVVVALAAASWRALALADEIDLRFVGVIAAWFIVLPLALRVTARARVVRAVLACLVLLLVAALWLLSQELPARVVIARYSPTVGIVARTVARIVDFDGDGHSFIGPEGDCAALDGSIHPFAVDLPDDGIDQDCHDGDLTQDRVPRTPGTRAGVPAKRHRPNVLLVTVEALRPDHLGIHGYTRDTSPRIDALFANAVVFERAYTVAPVTDRTLPAILTGVYPSRLVESLDYETHVLGDERVLLTERLRDAGYHTVVLQSFYLFDDHGLDQGIDDLMVLRDGIGMGGRPTTNAAITALRDHERDHASAPLFMWIHYYEPHSRYTPPGEHRLWDGGGDYKDENPMDLYDGEIHFVDSQIGRLLARARSLGLLDDAYVILSSDHGEEFLEHGRRQHAFAVYEESIRVPLLVSGPGLSARRIAEPFTLLDLTPTLLELLDIPFVDGIDGVSRADLLRSGVTSAPRAVLVEQYRHGSDELQKVALIDGSDKLILDLENNLWELYDLDADPLERENIYGYEGTPSLDMRERILDHFAMTRAVRLQHDE
jgi:arylsulfatase A-like enzyme